MLVLTIVNPTLQFGTNHDIEAGLQNVAWEEHNELQSLKNVSVSSFHKRVKSKVWTKSLVPAMSEF